MNNPIDHTPVMTTATALGAPSIDVSNLADGGPDADDSVEMPSCIEPPTTLNSRFNIKLYDGNCLDCDALVQNGEQVGVELKCHVSKGNTLCPAGSIAMIFTGLREYWLRRLQKAQEASGARFLQELNKLQEKDDDTRDWVLRQLGILRDEQQSA